MRNEITNGASACCKIAPVKIKHQRAFLIFSVKQPECQRGHGKKTPKKRLTRQSASLCRNVEKVVPDRHKPHTSTLENARRSC